MTLTFGAGEVASAYLGATALDAVYLGGEKVWPTSTAVVLTPAGVKTPGALALLGGKLFISDDYNWDIKVMDLVANTVDVIAGGDCKAFVEVDGKLYAYSEHGDSGVIDPATNAKTVISANAVSGGAVLVGRIIYSNTPTNINYFEVDTQISSSGATTTRFDKKSMAAVGTKIYSSSNVDVSFIDIGSALQPILISGKITGFTALVSLAAVGKKVYAADKSVTHISVIDTATDTVTGTIPLSEAPLALAVKGTTLYASLHNGGVAVVDTISGVMTGTISGTSNATFLLAAGNKLFCSEPALGTVAILDI